MIIPKTNSKKNQIPLTSSIVTLESIEWAICMTLDRLRVLESGYNIPPLWADLKKGQYLSALDIAKYSIASNARATMSLLGEVYTYLHRIREKKTFINQQSTRKEWVFWKAISKILGFLKRGDQSTQVIEVIEIYIIEKMIESITILEALEKELAAHSKDRNNPIWVTIWDSTQNISNWASKGKTLPEEKIYFTWRSIILEHLYLHELLTVYFPDFKSNSSSSNVDELLKWCKKTLQNIATWDGISLPSIPNALEIDRTNTILNDILMQSGKKDSIYQTYRPSIISPEDLNAAIIQTKEDIRVMQLMPMLNLSNDQQRKIKEMLTYWRIHS